MVYSILCCFLTVILKIDILFLFYFISVQSRRMDRSQIYERNLVSFHFIGSRRRIEHRLESEYVVDI